MKNCFAANSLNKSEIIREVYRSNPAATNKEIKKVVKQRYGFDAASNLLVQSIGSQKARQQLANRIVGIVKVAKDYLSMCGDDLELATRCLRIAG